MMTNDQCQQNLRFFGLVTMKPKEMKDWTSLDQILAETWAMLAQGVAHEHDPLHLAALGTTGPKGVELRTVVLRQAIQASRTLTCYADVRSPKIAEIRADPRVSWLFFHPQQQVQLRFVAQADLHTDDDLADLCWATIPLNRRYHYCAIDDPGTVKAERSSGLPDFLLNRDPTLEESEAGRKNFIVITTQIESLDWLVLSAQGVWRASFLWQADNQLTANWITP